MSTLEKIGDTPVWMCAAEGDTIRDERDVLDLIGDATYNGAEWVAIPAERLGDAFFQLRTRVAGEIVQKFVNYRMKLAVVGDISRHTDTSSALRDFVAESNRGKQTWFPSNIDELRERLNR